MQRDAERPNVLVALGSQTLKTLMVLGFFQRESVERTRCFADVGAQNIGTSYGFERPGMRKC